MFESIGNFFSGAKSFFSHGYDVVHDGVINAYHTVADKVQSVINIPSSVVTTVYADAKNLVSGVGNTITHVVDKGSDSVNVLIKGAGDVIQNGQNKLGDTVNGLGQSLSMPLVLLGGAGILFFLSKK